MIPKGWTEHRLGEFCHERRHRAGGAELPVLTVSKDLGIVLQSEKFKRRVASKDISRYKRLRLGEFAYDPMLLWSGSIARQQRVSEGVVSPAYYTFSVDESFVDPVFFEFFLRNPRMRSVYASISTGTNVRRQKAQFDRFCELRHPLPPLAEQRKIAEILGSVDDAIQATHAVIDQARRVKQGLLQQLLTRGIGHTRFKQTEVGEIPESWELIRLGELTERITKGESPRWQGFEYQKHGVLFVTSENVRDRVLDLSSPKFIPEDFGKKLSRSKLSPGDVLVNIVGASIGRAALWEEQRWANVNQAVAVVRPLVARVIPRLVLEAIYSDRGQAYLGLSQVESARPNVSLGSIRAFPMIVPPMHEQVEIVTRAKSVDDVIEKNAWEVDQLLRLKKGLMNDLLTGRVRVKVP